MQQIQVLELSTSQCNTMYGAATKLYIKGADGVQYSAFAGDWSVGLRAGCLINADVNQTMATNGNTYNNLKNATVVNPMGVQAGTVQPQVQQQVQPVQQQVQPQVQQQVQPTTAAPAFQQPQGIQPGTAAPAPAQEMIGLLREILAEVRAMNQYFGRKNANTEKKPEGQQVIPGTDAQPIADNDCPF